MFNNPKQKVAVLFFAVICVIAFFERKPVSVELTKKNVIVQPPPVAEVKKSDKIFETDMDTSCTTSISGITFPEKGYIRGVYIPGKACLDGVDITRFMSEGYEMTSGGYNKVSGVSYYTLYDKNRGVSKIIAAYVQPGNIPGKYIILDSMKSSGDTPETSLNNMVINYYNTKNSTLYFSTDAWAQSRAIHAIKFQNNQSFIIESEKFITDGDFVIMDGDNLVVSKIAHDEQGAYFPSYLIAPSGKEICQLDTRQEMWSIAVPCLPKGDVLKVRN